MPRIAGQSTKGYSQKNRSSNTNKQKARNSDAIFDDDDAELTDAMYRQEALNVLPFQGRSSMKESFKDDYGFDN